MDTKQVIERVFKEPGVKFELTEFADLGKPVHEILSIYEKTATAGKEAGKTKHYLKSFVPFSTGNEEVQVYNEGGKSAPEEIVRQLWVYKLIHQYGYRTDEIDLEKGVQFGTEVGTKAADIIVYTDSTKLTPKIIVECKKPKRKDGIEQLKDRCNLICLSRTLAEYQKPVGYTARFSEIEASRRADPEYYFPAFRAFKAALPNAISLSPLSNHLEFCQRGKQPMYSRTGLSVVNSKHVQPNRIVMDDNRLARANPDESLQIRFGDTLLNGTGRGTIGRAAAYLREEPAVADNHVTILRSRSLDPAFLAQYLNSTAGHLQVEMHQRGTSGQLELYPLDIRKFLVWAAPTEFQKEIRRLHDKAAAADKKSAQLLEQAKRRVEQLIEKAVQL